MSTLGPNIPVAVSATAPPRRAPADGERNAIRGYTRQYAEAAAAIYHGLNSGELRWVGLADRCAGIADDVVLGYENEVVGHQFKSSRDPESFRIATLLMGASGLLTGLVLAWEHLHASCPGMRIRIRVVVADTPSDSDLIGEGGTTRQFMSVWHENAGKSLEHWRSTAWRPFIDRLQTSSGLSEKDFESFFKDLELVHGDQPGFALRYGISGHTQPQVDRIADRLPWLVAQIPEKERWTRNEFLIELGWLDDQPRHRHQFPVGSAVQRNLASEGALRQAIRTHSSGYVSLVGPPGSGKSTLLQIALETEPQLAVVRYLAFVPDGMLGIGRAESSDFQSDLITGLRNTGLSGLRFRRESPDERREELKTLFAQAGERFLANGTRTLIIVDGLDHVPREERPERSFLADLPLPASVPEGVLFVLGTQRIDLPEIPPAVQAQAQQVARRTEMTPLSQEGISKMADAMGLPKSISRVRLRELGMGHPLATHYLLQALSGAPDEPTRTIILDQGFGYTGDIDVVYSTALHGLEEDSETLDVLGLVARAEAPLDLAELENFYPPKTVQCAWRRVHHLLKRTAQGFTIFHNSFRLFLLRQQSTRYGVPDLDHSRRLYRVLVDVAQSAAKESAQRYLVPRYLMRAGEHRRALDLATPSLFRSHYLAGRAASEIRDDIRLAFASLKEVEDPTAAFGLVLASDEIYRRAEAFEQPDDTVLALLAIGEIEEAERFLDEVGGDAYLVVDEWLSQGNLERARRLFEEVEPLHQLGSESNYHISSSRRGEYFDWVRRAIEFRTPAEVVSGVDRIVDAMTPGDPDLGDPEADGYSLRLEAALSTLAADPFADCAELLANYRLEPYSDAYLAMEAARCALLSEHANGPDHATAAILRATADGVALAEVPSSLRRVVALLAARRSLVNEARSIYEGLGAPVVADLDKRMEYESAAQVVRGVIEYAELAEWLGEPVAAAPQPEKSVLRRLQEFAGAAGRFAALSRGDPSLVPERALERLCRDFVEHLGRAGTGRWDEHFAVEQLGRASIEVLGSLLGSASRLGPAEFSEAVQVVDDGFRGSSHLRSYHLPLRILVAKAVARYGHSLAEAERRLDELLDLREEDTPGQFLGSNARLAIAYAQIDRKGRAKDLIQEQRAHTLGYAVRAKKDPQYAFWSALLKEANRVDPVGRAQRIRVLAHQAIGMAATEGRDAARRLAHSLIIEAANESAGLVEVVANSLFESSLIEFAPMVDAVLRGTLRRDPSRAVVSAHVWVSLCLPFHRAAYYREHEETAFVREVVRCAPQDQLDCLRDTLVENIVCHAQVDVRPNMLYDLKRALVGRGVDPSAVAAALLELDGVAAVIGRDRGSATSYDDVRDMAGLATRLEMGAHRGEVGYEAAMAFQRLLPASDLPQALAVFQGYERIQGDYASRFDLVDKALQSGERAMAERLTSEYGFGSETGSRWSPMLGGGLTRYFSARLRLEGEGVHSAAYANLASALVSGQEQVNSLLWRVEDIWPLITATPDWRGMWAMVGEQLPHTRDYRLGCAVPVESPLSDADVVARMIGRLIAQPVSDLRWHSGRASLALAKFDPVAYDRLIALLLARENEAALIALQLLRSSPQFELGADLRDSVCELTHHDDLGIRVLAGRICEQWAVVVPPSSTLPVFYTFALPQVEAVAGEDLLRTRPFGPPLVSDIVAWSAPFSGVIANLAEVADVSEEHICWRIQQMIDGWGGVAEFGQSAVDSLQHDLSQLGLKMTYFYPHITAGLRALRHIAGELAAAGRVPSDYFEELLLELHLPLEWPVVVVTARPSFVVRPALPDGRSDDEEWLNGVHDDADVPAVDGLVLAEITRFEGRYSTNHYEWSRFCLFGISLPATGDPVSLISGIPAGGFVRMKPGRSLGAVPRWELTLNPKLVCQLGWISGDDRKWYDSNGGLVATSHCWRDGGFDGESHGSCISGEGAAVVLTPLGRTQLVLVTGRLRTDVISRRSRMRGARGAERTARSSASLEPSRF